jgi:heterodisulfide reductase subunit A-like polyferredoxin
MDKLETLREYIRKVIREASLSGGGVAGATATPGIGDGGVAAKFAYNPNKKAKGTARNYYTKKLKFKLVPQGRPKSKLMDYKDLWI